MTRLFSLLLILGLLFTGMSTTTAQAPKFGHINSMELLSVLPGVRQADQQLEAFAKQLEEQNKNMLREYQTKAEEYQSREAMMLDAVKEVKLREISDLEQRIVAFQENAQRRLENKKEELYGPLLEKADDAIKAVAREHGYTYIFDTSSGALLHAEQSDNILPLVRQKLGL
ncbi:MAG: OmpH family outer membrane protein [Chitinophagaceae bacterium]|jgi:outer membrane protein|nr:MAG: OmpH family outer membrane protein [Chitinophagaceae bacterium]